MSIIVQNFIELKYNVIHFKRISTTICLLKYKLIMLVNWLSPIWLIWWTSLLLFISEYLDTRNLHVCTCIKPGITLLCLFCSPNCEWLLMGLLVQIRLLSSSQLTQIRMCFDYIDLHNATFIASTFLFFGRKCMDKHSRMPWRLEALLSIQVCQK